MRICMIADHFPPFLGGGSYCIYQLADALSRNGHKVAVVTWAIPEATGEENMDGIEVHRVAHLDFFRMRSLTYSVNAIPVVLRLIAEGSAEVVHAHGPACGAVGLACKALTGTPVLMTVHGRLYLGRRGDWAAATLEGVTSRRVDFITFDSVNLRQYFLDRYHLDAGRSVAIPNAVDTALFNPKVKRMPLFGLREDDTVVIYVGRLTYGKGLEDLIDGFNRACKRRGELKLLIVGEGPKKEGLMGLVRSLGLEAKVTFTGGVPHEVLPSLYARSDIAVLPSLSEGMSRMLLEAMSSGKAVVATDIPANRELVEHGENGLLVPPGDTVKLSEAILALATDLKERSRLGAEARRSIAERHNVEYRLSMMLRAYETVIEGVQKPCPTTRFKAGKVLNYD